MFPCSQRTLSRICEPLPMSDSSSAMHQTSLPKVSSNQGISALVSNLTVGFIPLAVVAFVVEVCLASTMPGHAIWAGGAFSASAFLQMLWFWFTAIPLTFALNEAVERIGNQAVRLVSRLGLRFVFAIGMLLHVASWGLFLQTGRFAGWETVRFALFNRDMLQEYILAADKWQIALAALVIISALAIFPVLFRKSNRDNGASVRLAFGIWITLCLSVFAANQAIEYRMANIRDSVKQNWLAGSIEHQENVALGDRLGSSLNPVASIFASAIESIYTEPLARCIDTEKLVKRTAPIPTLSAPGRNVIIVAVESLRHDMISAQHEGFELLPNINELSRQGVTWEKAYSQSTHSDYADVCLVSSLFPLRARKHHFYQSDDPWPRTMLHDVLGQEGYSTAIISSQNEDWGGMSNFLQTENLDCFYHPGNRAKTPTPQTSSLSPGSLVAGKFPDSHTTDAAMQWIEEQSKNGKSFCLGMNLQSSHFPYIMEEEVALPFQPSTFDSSIKFSSYPKSKVGTVRNAYYNAIRECDRQVGRLVDKLKQVGQWDNTILIVTGENGESFHENGCVGHAGNPMEPDGGSRNPRSANRRLSVSAC